MTLVTALISRGAGVAPRPQVSIIPLLLWGQVLNGMIVPVILVFILRRVNDPRLTGHLQNTRVSNLRGWGTVAVVMVVVVVLLGGQLCDRVGLQRFHTEEISLNHSALPRDRAAPAPRPLEHDDPAGGEASTCAILASPGAGRWAAAG